MLSGKGELGNRIVKPGDRRKPREETANRASCARAQLCPLPAADMPGFFLGQD